MLHSQVDGTIFFEVLCRLTSDSRSIHRPVLSLARPPLHICTSHILNFEGALFLCSAIASMDCAESANNVRVYSTNFIARDKFVDDNVDCIWNMACDKVVD